jgi:bacteriocin biosynthesis cyclodehydratase domain-containing protein
MHPVVKPGFFPITRDLHTLQLGRSSTRSLVLPNDDGVRHLLHAMDGSRSWPQVRAYLIATHGMTDERCTYLFDVLLATGMIDDAARPDRAMRALPHAERRRLTDDAEAWSRSRPEPSSAITALHRRRATWVEVDGGGRLAVGIAHLLALAGVGHVSVRDRVGEPVASSDLAPLGPHAASLGASTLDAARAAAAATSPDVIGPADSPGPTHDPDVVVIIGATHSPRADALLVRGAPHLFVHADAGAGIVGPFTISGRTTCGRCVERHRRDHDPARDWVMADAPDTVEALDTITATATAALAAAQVAQHLEHRGRPASCDALLVVDALSAMITTTPMAQHPHCGCTWTSAPAASSRTMAA